MGQTSEGAKKSWANKTEEERQTWRDNIAKSRRKPEVEQKRLEKWTVTTSKPGHWDAAGAKISATKSLPEKREQRSALSKAYWDALSTEQRQIVMRPMTNASHQPEAEAKRKQTMNEPEHRARHNAALKATLARPEVKAQQSALQKQLWSKLSPEERQARVANGLQAAIGSWCSPTKIETAVSAVLDQIGVDHVINKRIGRYYVDFLIESSKIIIEADGCYFHQCEECGYSGEKAEKKRAYDKVRESWLTEQGYTVIRIAEHDIRAGNFSALTEVH